MPTVGSQPYFLPASISPFGKAATKKAALPGKAKSPPYETSYKNSF